MLLFTLQCFNCISAEGQCTTTDTVECKAGEMCSALRINIETSGFGVTTVRRTCLGEDVCNGVNALESGITYSASVGVASLFDFISCCNSTKCNDKNIPEPNKTPNGLTCAACSNLTDTICNTTVSCVGDQDHCLTANDTSGSLFNLNVSSTVKGCASKTFCDNSEMGQLSCCLGNLCNGSDAWLRLNLSFFLMVLMVTILSQ